jgi:hypothetical protein
MDSVIAQPTPTAAPQIRPPNFFELSNRRIHVSFSSTSITGQPLLNYKDRQRQEETVIGTLVTVVLEPDADAGELLFTLVIPRVVLAAPRAEQRIETVGIFTRSRQPPHLPFGVQLQTYDTVELRGTASLVVS